MAELYKHMDERGTPINTTPAINGKDLDLYRLYRIVTFLGGHSRYVLHTQLSLFIRSCQKVRVNFSTVMKSVISPDTVVSL